jgi:hypothetical protein
VRTPRRYHRFRTVDESIPRWRSCSAEAWTCWEPYSVQTGSRRRIARSEHTDSWIGMASSSVQDTAGWPQGGGLGHQHTGRTADIHSNCRTVAAVVADAAVAAAAAATAVAEQHSLDLGIVADIAIVRIAVAVAGVVANSLVEADAGSFANTRWSVLLPHPVRWHTTSHPSFRNTDLPPPR